MQKNVRRASALVALLGASLAVTASAQGAHISDRYFYANPAPGSKQVALRSYPLYDNQVSQGSSCYLASGARTPDNGQYASYVYGNGYASHPYSGSNFLRPVAYFIQCGITGSGVAIFEGSNARYSGPSGSTTELAAPDPAAPTTAPAG